MRYLVLLPATVALACRAPTPAGGGAELRAVVEEYGAAWLRGDSAAVLALFAPDAVLLPHHGDPPVVGLDSIRAFWWPPAAPPTTVTTLDQTTDGVRVDGGTGIVWGRFTIGFSWEDDAGETKSLRNGGTYLMALRRDGERWRITHRMWDDPVARTD